MANNYGSIAFTEGVRDLQTRYGSRQFYARQEERGRTADGRDELTAGEREYLAGRDGFYVATVSDSGWPYVQFRGGPPGFLRVIDEHTLGWADFRGNGQYISTGNLTANDRVALFVMDYPRRQRLKIFGHARIAFAEDEPELVAKLFHPEYKAVVERAIVVSVDAFDWNCRQHITPRFSATELEPQVSALRHRIATLEAENAALRAATSS